MSGHQSARAQTVEWLTPPEWIEKLGPFDLDPACPPSMPWRTAGTMLTKAQDGLTAPWYGRVWLNPPFGQQAASWLRRGATHGSGISLIPARTETEMFRVSVWWKAHSVCFVHTRPHFHVAEDTWFKRKGKPSIFVKRGDRAPCNSGAPIALVAYSWRDTEILRKAKLGPVMLDWGMHEKNPFLEAAA